MSYRRTPLADVPTSGRQYYPNAAELATAQATADANGWGIVGQPWNIEADGSTFEVPTDRGGMRGATRLYQVRFGFGRGAFANFPPPAPGVGTSPQVAAAPAPTAIVAPVAPTTAVTTPAVTAPTVPAAAVPVPTTAIVQTAAGPMPIAAAVETAPPAAAPPAAPSGGGFDVASFLNSLFSAPAMQPITQGVAQQQGPSAINTAVGAWFEKNKALVIGGGVAALGLVWLVARSGGRRRA